MYICLSLSFCIYFLLADVTALTCSLGASYLGYLRKYQRLLHCRLESRKKLMRLLKWNSSRSSLLLSCHLCNVFYAAVLPVMAERSALLVKIFFIPSSCRVLLRSIFCSTLNLKRPVTHLVVIYVYVACLQHGGGHLSLCLQILNIQED